MRIFWITLIIATTLVLFGCAPPQEAPPSSDNVEIPDTTINMTPETIYLPYSVRTTSVNYSYYGPVNIHPQGGGTTSLRPGFVWIHIVDATEYEFVLAEDAKLTQVIFITTNTTAGLSGSSRTVSIPFDLKPNTRYFWAVQVIEPYIGYQFMHMFETQDATEPSSNTSNTNNP